MKITAAESLIMEILWRADRPLAVEELREELRDANWTDGTVRSFMSRLVHKGAVAASKDGKRFLYRPLLVRADYVHAESKGLIDRLFDGQIGPFVAHFSERQNLSAEELAQLRDLIERLDHDQ
ncbi:MAG: BlaI/MecI/CopY family transcriptional regulator [Alphaproteobacteria bacterium]